MQPHCLGKVRFRGRSGGDNRLFVEPVLWIARTGGSWRDIPSMFGNRSTIYSRFRDHPVNMLRL